MLRRPRLSIAVIALALGVAGCSSGDDDAANELSSATESPSPDATVQATPEPSPAPSILTPKSDFELLLDRGEFTVSDDWVVETVVADLDMNTGGLAILDDGTFLQADFGGGGDPGDTLHRVAPAGDVDVVAQSDGFGALTMTSIGLDGAIYQTGYNSDSVHRIGLDGTIETLSTEVSGAAGVIADADGTVFAGSYDTGTVVRIDPDGTQSEFARDVGLSSINSLAHGPDGRIFAANHRNGKINEITRDGEVVLLHEFPKATSHLVFHEGALFVTSRGLHVVLRLDLETGAVEVIAGDGEPGDADGRGTAASFARPNAITVGPDGHLYFNHGAGRANSPVTIRRIVPAP